MFEEGFKGRIAPPEGESDLELLPRDDWEEVIWHSTITLTEEEVMREDGGSLGADY